MINYIIIEDDMIAYQRIKDFIDNYMMNYDYNYKIQNYQEIIDDTGFKVYYISKKDYLNIVEDIRSENWISPIFLIKPVKVESNYNISDIFIYNKLTFKKTLSISLNMYNSHPKQLSFSYKNTIYVVYLNDIIYIEKEYDSKNCIIYTKSSKYITNSSINRIMKKLDSNFVKTSRSTILNINYIKQYNIRENTAILKDESTYNSISKSRKQQLINKIRNV